MSTVLHIIETEVAAVVVVFTVAYGAVYLGMKYLMSGKSAEQRKREKQG